MKRTRLIVVAAMASMLALAGTTAWAGGNPPGNNGTVKVDGKPFDKYFPNNEPHVGCSFQIDFYGFDKESVGTATLELQPPSGTAFLLTKTKIIGGDDAGGGTDFDGLVNFSREEIQVALVNSGGVAHPIQGYHIKLTTTATGSQGADTKHKVFWVQDCAPYAVA